MSYQLLRQNQSFTSKRQYDTGTGMSKQASETEHIVFVCFFVLKIDMQNLYPKTMEK